MSNLHKHAAAIDRIGKRAIRDYFNLTPQAVGRWRKAGVPKHHLKTLAMLGAVAGHQVPELTEDINERRD